MREGIRIRPPNENDLAWCARVGVAPMFAKIEVDVTLRRVSDGVERVCVGRCGFQIDAPGSESEDEAIDAAIYQWTEGNYGCDCNRGLFFSRADPDEEFMGSVCSHGAYRIVAPTWLAELDTRR